jgi:hypothetical protein
LFRIGAVDEVGYANADKEEGEEPGESMARKEEHF